MNDVALVRGPSMREGEWKSGREMNGVTKNLQQYSNLQDRPF